MKILSFSFFLFLILPSIIYVSMGASSMTIGTIVGSVLFIFFLPLKNFFIRPKRRGIIAFFFVLTTQLLFVVFSKNDEKQLFSVLISIFLLFSCYIMANQFSQIKNVAFVYLSRKILYILLFLGIVQIYLNLDFLGYDKFAKSIFPFSEPSHYAIALGPFLIYESFYMSNYKLVLISFLLLLMGVSYPSFTLIFLLFIILGLRLKNLTGFVTLALILFLIYSLSSAEDFDYFSERFVFNKDITNLTALVYLQGWEDAYNGLKTNFGFGYGFQNMGKGELGYYGELIVSILGETKNRNDGGFLAAKIVGEFGLLGLLFLIFYIKLLIKAIKFFLSSNISDLSEQDTLKVFTLSIVISFFVELFLRGYGYFTPGVILFTISVIIIQSKGYFKKSKDAFN